MQVAECVESDWEVCGLAANPVVLLVENDAQNLDLRRQLFEAADCTVLGVTNSDDAIREVWSSPLVSLVVTDINLSDTDTKDMSGLALMHYLAEAREGLPVAGYSGHFAERAIPKEDRDRFVRWYKRGSLTAGAIEQSVRDLRDEAVKYQERRRADAEERLTELRVKHGIDASTLDTYRSLLPNRLYEVEQILAASGFEALAVATGPPRKAGAAPWPRVPVLFWIRSSDDGVEAEVFGVPQLYGVGKTQDEAVALALELMVLFYTDLRADTNSLYHAAELRDFLFRVFALVEP